MEGSGRKERRDLRTLESPPDLVSGLPFKRQTEAMADEIPRMPANSMERIVQIGIHVELWVRISINQINFPFWSDNKIR